MAGDKKVKKVEKIAKPLCKLVKNDFLDDELKIYKGLVRKPGYICRKCGRAAGAKKNLCKPEEL